jgi:hypothetical protein
MVVVAAHRFTIVNVKRFIREGFLIKRWRRGGRTKEKGAYVTNVAVETLLVVFALELTVGRRDSCLFDGLIASSALKEGNNQYSFLRTALKAINKP